MKIIKNYTYNLSYQVLVILLPILTTPYVTRIFSSKDLGTYGYYNSIVAYFVLLATLGVMNYGTKKISESLENVKTTFWNIYLVQFCAGVLSISFYFLSCMLISGMQNPVAYVLVFSLFSKTLDISWLFQGMEDFKRITMRNIAVKLVGVSAIFLFIHTSQDLLLYIFLIVFFEMIGQVVMWLPARNHIGKPTVNLEEMFTHIKPIILLFIPQVAISLYATMDRTLLGSLSSVRDVGLYDQAYKIISILLTVVTSLGSVMMPRVTNIISKEGYQSANKLHNFSFLVYNVLIFPLIAGMILVNEEFVQMFLGSDFQDAKYAIYIMVFKIFFIGWTNILGFQMLIPLNKNKEFMLSTTIPALISISLNFIFIPWWGYIGAAITSLLTECFVWFFQLYFTRNQMKNLNILGSLAKIILVNTVMVLFLLPIRAWLHFSPFVNIMILILCGVLFYGGGLFILKVVDIKTLRDDII